MHRRRPRAKQVLHMSLLFFQPHSRRTKLPGVLQNIGALIFLLLTGQFCAQMIIYLNADPAGKEYSNLLYAIFPKRHSS